jgi:hypothetical protein
MISRTMTHSLRALLLSRTKLDKKPTIANNIDNITNQPKEDSIP